MKFTLQIISIIALLMTIVPPVLFFQGEISLHSQNFIMSAGTVIWFISASFWLGSKGNSVKK